MSKFVVFTRLVCCLIGVATSQQAGEHQDEAPLPLGLQECTISGGCAASHASITLDANWRWAHETGGYQNCYKDGKWVEAQCPDPITCAKNCALEGASVSDYKNTYGITTVDNGIELKFVSKTQYGSNYGSRVYLMHGVSSYRMFKLKNREFTMDISTAELPCGLNGAVYFVEMDEFGGLGGNNNAGAKYGTGYCDAQCPHDVKFVDGEANSKNWNSTSKPPVGHYGMCCAEMDIWEANSMSTGFTPHPCNIAGPMKCEGTTCGDTDKGERYNGVCDKDGCDFNSYRMGNQSFYGPGPGFVVDSAKPVTVVTQFVTTDNTDAGELKEVRRFYVQDGNVIPNSQATILGDNAGNSVTDGFCNAQKTAFGDANDFKAKGSLKQMGDALDRGMVLALSLWDDTQVNMLWLDSTYPTDESPTKPGVARGPCPGGETSSPAYLRANYHDASVKYMNLKVGEIGSTFVASRRLAPTYV